MREEREVTVEGVLYRVVISDEEEALLAAKAAGRAFVGVEGKQTLWGADYVVEDPAAADSRLLERVVRRKLGMPWILAESDRLCIREFTAEDAKAVPEELYGEDDSVFFTADKLEAYIRNQYGFYEYGIWAVVRKADGIVVGKAGVTDCECRMELGYHIFAPYRRQGYGREACSLILDYVAQEYDCPVYATVKASNTASKKLLQSLGFVPAEPVTTQRYSGSEPLRCLYVRYLR